jgi:hypothetical protein
MSEEKRPNQSGGQSDHAPFEPLADEIERCANQLDKAAKSLSERFSKPTLFMEFFQPLPPEPVTFDPQTIGKHRELLTFTLNVPLGLFDTLIDRCFIEAPSLIARLKEIYGEVLTEARHLIAQLDMTAPMDLTSWFRFTDSNIPFAARRLRRMAALLRLNPDPPDEPEEEASAETQVGGTAPPEKPVKELKNRFTFKAGQALFAGKDLGLEASQFARDVLKKLVKGAGKVVSYPTLDKDSAAKEASERLRTAVVAIRRSLRRKKTGCEIVTTRGTGYCLRKKTISRSPHDNSR